MAVPASAQVSPSLKSQVKQLIRYANGNFSAIRIDSTRKDAGGDHNYKVKGFNACGSKSQYNKVWHWRTMKGNWEYVCDVDFKNEYGATKYYDDMSRVLTSIGAFNWEDEKVVNSTTRRRLVGRSTNPNLKIMFDYDVADDGSVEIEFWFKQKFNPGAVKSGGGGGGQGNISPTLKSQVGQLLNYSKGNFSAIRIDSSRSDSGGDHNYKVKGFNACGPQSQYNKVWHWRTMKGNWEYVCDVDFSNRAAADAYYNAMSAVLKSVRGYTWEREQRVNDSTVRRLVGKRTNPPIKIMFDYDLESGGAVEIEFWFKQKNNPGAATGNAPSGKGASVVSPILRSQVKQLVRMAKTDFSAIRIQSSRRSQGGDDNYKVKGFNACGPKSEYNKVWHWKSMKGNWEYVCDVNFSNRADATAYYDEMVKQLTGVSSFRWEPEQRKNNTTIRRLVGRSSNPPLKIMMDYDVESGGGVEIEFWFKQKFNK